jgi:AraC-like DNA-binding protein
LLREETWVRTTVTIPVVHRNAAVRAAIRRGLPGRGCRVVAARSIDRVQEILERALVDAVVVDVVAGAADPAFELAHRYPRIPVFALSRFRPDHGSLLGACRRAGLAGILVEGVDGPVAGEVIWRGTASRTRRMELVDAPRLLRLTEPLQIAAWEAVLERAGGPLSTTEVAQAVGSTREHLSREFAAGGAPNLKRVIDLARAAWAADLLGNPGYSVATVAAILGYSSPSHLTASSRRVAGVTAGELGKLGPRGVLERFRRGRTRSRV